MVIFKWFNSNEPIYKIGKTIDFNKRISGYDKGTETILLLFVKDCDSFERIMIDLFNKKFTKMNDYGNEYFRGDVSQMISFIMDKFYECSMCYSLENIEEQKPKIIEAHDELFIQKRNLLLKIMNKVNEKNFDNFRNNYHLVANRIKTEIHNNECIQLLNDIYNAVQGYQYYYNPFNAKNISSHVPKKMGDYFERNNPNLLFRITYNYLNVPSEDSKKIYNLFKSIIS